MSLAGRFLSEKDLAQAGFKSLGTNLRVHEYANIVGVQNITLGDNVRIDAFVNMVAEGKGHIRIGSHVHIASFCNLGGAGGIVMDDFSSVSHGGKIYSASDDYSGQFMTNPTVPRECLGVHVAQVHIARHVIIGAGTVVLPGVRIGEGSAVGALSLVTTELAPWGVYVGIPAKYLKARAKDLLDLEKKIRGS